jgi:hypothetical protein
MRVLSTILSVSIISAMSFGPVMAADNTASADQLADGMITKQTKQCAPKKKAHHIFQSHYYTTQTKTTTTTTSTSTPVQPVIQPAVVEQPVQPVCPPQPVVQPAVVQECPRRANPWPWILGTALLGGSYCCASWRKAPPPQSWTYGRAATSATCHIST